MKVQHINWYPRVDAGFTSGQLYKLVYLYAPEGTLFVHGSYDNIKNYLKRYDLVHGFSMFCENRYVVRIGFELFGEYSDWRHVKEYYSLTRRGMTTKKRNESEENNNMMRSHPKYFLDYTTRNMMGEIKEETVASWRRMPRTYPRIFKELQESGR